MLKQVVLLIVGFILLVKGADIFVEGSSKIAEKLNIPQIVIGLTIVAFGTSAPEAAVSIASAYRGTSEIAVGNIIGSNVANVLLILGVSGLIGPLVIKRNTLRKEIPFVIFITLLLLMLGLRDGFLSKIDGCILLAFFGLFLYYLYGLIQRGEETSLDDVPELEENDHMWKLICMVIIGAIAIVFGSRFTVNSASAIASHFGVSERVIGLTIVSIGTSLPELVTSVSASMKGKTDIAIGNIIGSNIFNILLVLGLASVVSPMPIPFPHQFLFDGLVAIGAIIMFILFIGKDMKLKRLGAGVMLVSYVVYLVNIL